MTRRKLGFYFFEVAGFTGTIAVLLPLPWWAWLAVGVIGWLGRCFGGSR